MPTLPNDSFRIGLSTFIRAQPMLAPLMHEVRLFTQYWFVPNRILWDEWEDFITGGNDLTLTPPFPTVTLDDSDVVAGSLTDYFGFPLVKGLEVSALPYRAMAEIWNTRYRDEDLQAELPIDYGSSEDTTTNRGLLSPSFAKDYFTTARPFTQRGGDVLVPIQGANTTTNYGLRYRFRVLACHHTTANNAEAVYLNLGTCASDFTDVYSALLSWFEERVKNNDFADFVGVLPSYENSTTARSWFDSTRMTKHLFYSSVSPSSYTGTPARSDVRWYYYVFLDSAVHEDIGEVASPDNFFEVNPFNSVAPNCPSRIYAIGPSNQYASRAIYPFYNTGVTVWCKISNDYTSDSVFANALDWEKAAMSGSFVSVEKRQVMSGLSIRDLRRSSALQRYAERSLNYGNRYEEFIQREFGIKPRDYRIQRPEYLGGGRGILNISEVLQTAESTDTGVGTMRGHGIASISQRPIRFRCPEHGIILGLLSIRPKSVYTQGVDREWLKRSRLDFFTPELASIGMQEVLQQELYAMADNVGQVFGYSERYQEYRYQKPLVTGEFRTNLSFWNMARLFANSPNLNDEFINMGEAVSDFKRPFQIQDNSAHAFVCMLKNHIRAYRPIPKRAKDVLR